jgi:hypothetical protein
VRERYNYLLPILNSFGCSLNQTNKPPLSNNFTLFPIPADEILSFSETVYNIKLYTILGEQMCPEIKSATSISTANLKSGVYFLNTSVGNKKIIVQHD